MTHTDTSDDAQWRTLLHDLPIPASSDLITSRASSLSAAISADPELLGYVVGELMCQADENPKHIDTLLSIYKWIADFFNGDTSLTAYGSAFSGSVAVHKSFDIEIVEASQTAGTAVEAYHPYDVSCPISADEPLQGAIDRVLVFGEARRSWFIVHALYGRSRVIGVGIESKTDHLEHDFALETVRLGVGLGGRGEVPDETHFLNALILLLSAGHVLRDDAKKSGRESEFTEVYHALKASLRTETNFRRKHFIAHVLKVLDGEEQWTSARLFDETTWIH